MDELLSGESLLALAIVVVAMLLGAVLGLTAAWAIIRSVHGPDWRDLVRR